MRGLGGIFGSGETVSTLDPTQRQSMNSLMNEYQRQINNGPQVNKQAVENRLNNIINPEIRRNSDEAVNQAKANMGSGFWGTDKLSALAKLQRMRNDTLASARTNEFENERQAAQMRYANAQQGLSGLMNVQTQAIQRKPGMLDYANQLMGTAANGAAIYSAMGKRGS